MCRRWHTNGQLSFRQKLSGKWMTWDEKGRKEMVIYDGRRKGFSKHFDTTGRLVSYGYYKKLGWGATEYHNGKKILLVRYKKGSPITGSCIENENPDDARYQHRICVYMVGGTEVKIKHDSTISDLEGKIIKNHFKGKTKKCYPNGQRQGVCYYKKGKVNGWLREWDENGKLIRKKLFRAGKCVKTVKDYEGPYFISKTEQPGLINE